MSEIALLVLAETLVLIAGKMDLSLESTFGLAPGIAAWLTVAPGVTHGLGPAAAAPGPSRSPSLVGALVGAFNGLLIVRFRLNGFIVTLGMLIVLRGLLTGISGGQTFFGLPPSMLYLGNTNWLGMPASIWVCLLAVRDRRSWCSASPAPGRALYAIGGNVDAARAAGIRTDRVLWLDPDRSPARWPRSAGCCCPAGSPRSPPRRATATSSRCSPPRSSAASASTAARAPCSAPSPASCCCT